MKVLGTELKECAPEGVLTVGELLTALEALDRNATVEIDVCTPIEHKHYSIGDIVCIDNKSVLIYAGSLTAIITDESLEEFINERKEN